MSVSGLLQGKVAIVTGGGAGIGRGVARRFAREGAVVVIAEVHAADGERTGDEIRAAGGRCLCVPTDVADKAQVHATVARTVKEFGRVDVLVNNASALSPNVLLEKKTDAMLERTLRTGMWATWWFMQACLPHMRAQGGGRVINFHSIDADAAAWLHADYNMNKAAIQALTRSAAVEWGRFNILVNAVAPTAAGTVFKQLVDAIPGFAEMAAQSNPLGRVGDPEDDIAPVLVFLASELGRYVTGETINVDGGQHLPRYQSRPADLAALEAGC